MSKKKKKYSKVENVLTTILLAVLAVIIVWSASHLISAFWEYYKGQHEYSGIREGFTPTAAELETEEKEQREEIEQIENSHIAQLREDVEAKLESVMENEKNREEESAEVKQVIRYVGERQYVRDQTIIVNGIDVSYYIAVRYTMDLAALKEINSEVLGWIRIEGTNIDYPMVQTDNNETYIRQTIYGTKNAAGSIFVDCNVKHPFDTDNTIIYGHNQRNKQMFHDLVYYENYDYYAAHPNIMIYLENETRVYQIFCCYITQNVSITYDCQYSSEGEYQSYLDQIMAWKFYDTGVSVSTSDQIITLSTCTNDWNDTRFVVHAKRII
ncbi:MAG: class B sortase [Lachnospiraceae bacterium]